MSPRDSSVRPARARAAVTGAGKQLKRAWRKSECERRVELVVVPVRGIFGAPARHPTSGKVIMQEIEVVRYGRRKAGGRSLRRFARDAMLRPLGDRLCRLAAAWMANKAGHRPPRRIRGGRP